MMRESLRAICLAGTLTLSTACAPADKPEDADTASKKGQLCVYMKVIPDAPEGGATVFADLNDTKPSGYIGADMPVVRMLTVNNQKGEQRMQVKVGYGSLTGQTVWIDSGNLMVRPNYGGCSRELSNVGEFAISQDPNLMKQTVMCFVGLGSGAIGGVKDIFQGVWDISSTIVSRDIDMLRSLTGDKDAYQRLVVAGQNDVERVKALASLATNAIPALQIYLAGEYEFFRYLPPARQSEVLCQVLGKISLDVLIAAADAGPKVAQTAGTATTAASKATTTSTALVKVSSKQTAIVKAALKNYGDDVAKAAQEAGVKGAQAASTTVGAAKVLEQLNAEAIKVAKKVLAACANPSNPYGCLGVASTASKAEVKAAYKVLVKKVHPDLWKATAAGDKVVVINGEAAHKISEAQKAVNVANDAIEIALENAAKAAAAKARTP